MQSWRDLITSYPDSPERKDYAKALRTAEILISEELAPFEIEWLAHTLLFKPVDLFKTVFTKRQVEDWYKSVSDSFKVLSQLIEKYWEFVEPYHSAVITLCMLPCYPKTKKDAIMCLISLVKHNDVQLLDEVVTRNVNALENATTCKAPLALLVGTMCRHHPEKVQAHCTTIWKTYSRMLQSINNTDVVVCSVLQGVNDLLTYFGDNIQTMELNKFYDVMSREYFKIHKCVDVLLAILKDHARYFVEKLSEDRALRLFLWQIETKSAMDALTNVYSAVLPILQNNREILNSEVLPHVECSSLLIKHTALKIIVKAKPSVQAEVPILFSGIDLEYQLKAKKLSYEEASAVAWCLESSVDTHQTMLRTVIMYYDNLPTSKRRDMVVNGILKSFRDVRKPALELLVKMCLQENLDKYIDVWRVLLDNTTERTTNKAMDIFKEALHHLSEMLAYLTQDSEKAYAEVRPVLNLMSVFLSLLKTDFSSGDWCTAFRPAVVHLARRCGVHPTRVLDHIPLPDEVIYVEKFLEDTVYYELMSTLPAPQCNARDETLSSLQVIFSKDGTDAKVLSKALLKLDDLIRTENNNLDSQKLSMILNRIQRLKSKSVVDNKDGRIFQKDVALFLGKYGDMAQIELFFEDIYVLKFKNKLTLNVPNIIEGTTHKIDLQRVLQLSLLWGEREALYALLVILSANLCDRSDPSVQEATVRVIHALFRARGRESETEISVYPALLMCNTVACVQTIMKCITEEPCVEVRRKLSGCLEVLLTHDPGSDVTSQLVQSVAEQAMFMIGTDEPSTVDIGLDITTSFIAAIKDNNSLIVDNLPIILIQTSNISIEKSPIFEIASNLFIEMLDLFTKDSIKSTLIKILEKYTIDVDMQLQTHILGFIKRVIGMRLDTINVVDEILGLSKNLTIASPQFVKIVALLAFSCAIFDFNTEIRKQIIGFDNGLFLEELLNISYENTQVYSMNAVLLFLKEYATELLENDAEKTSQCLCNLIENMAPNTVIALKKPMTDCFSFYKTVFNDRLQLAYSNWSEKLIYSEKITHYIEGNVMTLELSEKTSEAILALKIMTDLDFLTENARSWTSIILSESTSNEWEWGSLYLSDILTISAKCMTRDEFEKLVEENTDFVTRFVNVYFERFIEKPFFPIRVDCNLLCEVIEHYTKVYKEDTFDDFIDFVEHLWPESEELKLRDDHLSALFNLLSLPKKMRLDAGPMKWAICLLGDGYLCSRSDIISLLPAGEEYSIYYKNFVSSLPVCLSEMVGTYVSELRALLDALATNGDMTLLDIVITLAGGDSTKGWWDYAIEDCMRVLAGRHDINIVNEAYRRARTSANLGICNRIFLPLLRHSSRKFVHDFIASIVSDLHARVGFQEPANTAVYRKIVFTYALKFNILKLAFDKLSAETLQCGVLNERAGSPKPWHFVEESCKYCVTLSTKAKCPEGASADLREACLWLQCSAYNCLTAAICKRKPNKKLYAHIFNAQAWANIVDKDAVYTFEVRAHSTYKGSRPSKRSADELATSAAFTGTVRSRLFLTTLSENPLQYDMIPHGEDLDDDEDNMPEFDDSVLNVHGCLSTVTSLLEHASTLEHTDWRTTLVDVITSDVIVNVKWMLAQAVCNAEESLKPHAAFLIPALFHLIADTPQNTSGLMLNNLHIDILSTIIHWNVPDVSIANHIDSTINYLITTCMEYKKRTNIERRLLNILNGVLILYGNQVRVQWDLFRKSHEAPIKAVTSNLPILERLLKNKVAIPELLPTIFDNTDSKLFTNKLAEITGLALALADSESRDVYLAKFWAILAPLKSSDGVGYIKLLFYAQRHCRQCCVMNHFKIITSFATKMEKSKCLSIMSTYLEHASNSSLYFNDMFETISLRELLEGDLMVDAMKIARSSFSFMEEELKSDVIKKVAENCGNSSVKIRMEAYRAILTAFQELFLREDHHPPKRRAVDSTPILDSMDSTETIVSVVIQKVFHGIFDDDEQVSAMVCDGVECCLSKDVTVRFAELFYLMVYQSFLSRNLNVDMSNCGTKLLQLLFQDLRENEAFNSARLREDGLPQSILKVYEAITTKTRTRTVLRSSVTYRQTVVKAPKRREIDVQMTITNILDIFLQFSKVNSQVSLELCREIMKCLRATSRRFDLDAVMSKQLCVIMKKEPNCLTPIVLEACRVFISRVSSVQGFKDSVHDLSRGVRNSEGYMYTKILYEDLVLRSGDESQFLFSVMKEDPNPDAVMREEQFTLQGVKNVFGSLSNWNDLKLQERRRLEDSLPPLWTKDNDFAFNLREYFDAAHRKLDDSLWLNKMVASYYMEEVSVDRYSWLKDTDTWPTRHFVTSAIIEAIQWHQSGTNSVTTDLRASDCLAEWAARLMIRSAFKKLTTNNDGDDLEGVGRSSLGDLVWCAEANRRGLPSLALQCIERNKDNLLDVDILPWVKERVIAYRTIGLREKNHSSLQKALGAAETQSKIFSLRSSLDTNVSMQHIILLLHQDLNTISINKLDNGMQTIDTVMRQNDGKLSSTNRQVLKSLYDDAMVFYDELWCEDERTQNTIILRQTEIIGRMLDYNLGKNYDLIVSVLLNRIAYSKATIREATAKIMLDQIYRVFHKLDFFSVAILKKVVAVLPGVDEKYLNKLKEASVDDCKEYFRLICDVNYALLQYCNDLHKRLSDNTQWEKTFETIKNMATHGGSDYQSLNTLKNKLYALQDMVDIKAKANTLKSIIEELTPKSQRSNLRLSQVTPRLCLPSTLEDKRRELQSLLRLPPNVYVVKFCEQVSVITDSKRRPCVIKALLSNGSSRRYICKSGEPLFKDAAIQRVAAILPLVHPSIQVRSYNVTPLSEDSAIIEYLEDHGRLRDTMKEAYDFNTIVVATNDKLILAPSLALEQYNDMCDKIPPYILRSAIEKNCSSVKEFIAKKQTFEETLSSMTLLNWMFGVGDRHLENILVCGRACALGGVDWACALSYSREPPPARLTRNLLAVAGAAVVETRLQNLLSSLRGSRKLLKAFIRTSFYWLGPSFEELKHVTAILEGSAVSYDVSRACIESSNKMYKDDYLKLLDEVFVDFPKKETYSVEEQVSCLLHHCTDPRILSVTPQGWEPWL